MVTYAGLGIVIFTVFIAELGSYIFSGGINIFLTHLFYFPVIFAAFQYPKRGILIATIFALIYVGLTYLLTYPNLVELIPATMQFYVLISLGAAISVMSGDLQLHELKYRSIFSNAGNGICLVDAASGRVLESNSQALWMLGIDVGNLTHLEQLFPDAVRREAFLGRIRANETVADREVHISDAKGSDHALLLSARPLPGGLVIMTLTDITERKQHEEVLRESERKFRELADLLPQPVFEFDKAGVFTFANKSASRTFGYSTDDIAAGLSVLQVVAPADRKQAWDGITSVLNAELPENEYAVEYTMMRKDGSLFPAVIYSSPISHEGTTLGIRGVIVDTTQRREAEEQDRQHMRTMEFLSRTATDFVQMPGDADIYRHISDRIAELFLGSANVVSSVSADTGTITPHAATGPEEFLALIEEIRHQRSEGLCFAIPSDAIEQMLCGDLVEIRGGIEEASFGQLPPGILNRVKEPFGLFRVYGIGFSCGTELFGTALVFLPPGSHLDRPNALTAFIHQTSIALQRRRAEMELRESEEKYRLLYEGSSDGIFLMTETFIDCNDTACSLWGYSREEIIGRSPADLSPAHQPDGRSSAGVADKVIGAALAGSEQSFSWQLQRKDGSLIDVEISLKALTVHGRQVLFATMRDITERRRSEMALQQANMKLYLLSSITRHDILNQITGIVGYLGFLESAIPPDPKLHEYTRRISEITATIQRQITFTRDYEEMGMEAPLWQRIDALVWAAAKSLEMNGIDLRVDTGTLEVFADPMMEKAFFNLLENSIRHGERVTEIRVSFQSAGGRGLILIQDNGVGIPRRIKERIFQRGFGRNTGFGLFLVKEILSITGLSITETGDEGAGARFEISVPEWMLRFEDSPADGNRVCGSRPNSDCPLSGL